MFVRLLYLNFQPGRINEAKKIYSEEIVPAARKSKGFVDCKLLEPVDHSESFIALSEWKNQSDAIVYETSDLYDEQRVKVNALLTKEPVLKTYTFETADKEIPAWIGGDIEE